MQVGAHHHARAAAKRVGGQADQAGAVQVAKQPRGVTPQALLGLLALVAPVDQVGNDVKAARLSRAGEEAFGELRSLYLQDMRLRVPPVVKAWYVEDEEKYRLEEIFGQDLSLVRYL